MSLIFCDSSWPGNF